MKIGKTRIDVEISAEGAVSTAQAELEIPSGESQVEPATLRFHETSGQPVAGVRGQFFPFVSESPFGTPIRAGFYGAARKASQRGSVSTDYDDSCLKDQFNHGATLKSDLTTAIGIVGDAKSPIGAGFEVGAQVRLGIAHRQGTLIHGREFIERNGCGDFASQNIDMSSGLPSITPVSINDILHRTSYGVNLVTAGSFLQVSKVVATPETVGSIGVGPIGVFLRGGLEIHLPAPGETGQIGPSYNALAEVGMFY